MARLKTCKDCGHKISKSAESCPNCGARFKRRWNEIGKFTTTLIIFVLLIFVLALFSQA